MCKIDINYDYKWKFWVNEMLSNKNKQKLNFAIYQQP